nr:EAL domain-containing protein [Halanaerobium saccharolyticum]
MKNIGQEKATENIINSIINMAHALELKVVAEGVETKAQLDFLKGLDCDYAQGYYFARPDTKENIIQWLLEEKKYSFNKDRLRE